LLKCNILNDSEEEIQLLCHISKVRLMPYTSDGYQNHQFPKQSLSFNVYINKKELSEELEDFLNTSY
jgi:hypothetical protein